MTQNTLSEEIEKIITDDVINFQPLLDIAEGRADIDSWNEKLSDIYLQLSAAMKSIAEKTVEAVRVGHPEDMRAIREGYFITRDRDLFDQAITEQSKLASRWLGKEN